MSHITALDTTGAFVLRDAVTKLHHRDITVLFSGLREDHHRRLAALDALPAADHLFTHTEDAIAYARDHLPAPVRA
jgi:SulP family sulfate permease